MCVYYISTSDCVYYIIEHTYSLDIHLYSLTHPVYYSVSLLLYMYIYIYT